MQKRLTYCILAAALIPTAAVQAQSPANPAQPGNDHDAVIISQPMPSYYYDEWDPKPHPVQYYYDGHEGSVQVMTRWKYMCGSDTNQGSVEDLAQIAANHAAAMTDGPKTILGGNGSRAGQLNVVYVLDSSVPPAAVNSFALAKAYIESKFSNPIVVVVNVNFGPLGSGIIGGTSSASAPLQSYADSRAGLVAGKDSNDTIQDWLPLGTTCPVRFNGASSTVNNFGTVSWTTANFKASLGAISAVDAGMTYNSQFGFDYDPSNGVSGLSLVDTIIHETGHAMGFVSGADDFNGAFTTLDLYRFQNTDGCCNYNPDTLAQFQTTTRTVSYNSPNDDAITDVGTAEYRMSDGSPYQASHFREQSPSIGIMDPAQANGETKYPNYYKQSDLDAFDAIGWQYPPCTGPAITQQPTATQTICPGGSFSLSTATSAAGATYQWRRFGTLLVDGPNVSGATTAHLTVTGATTNDSNQYYNCLVTAGSCSSVTSLANVTVLPGPQISPQPANASITIGATAQFSCSANPPANFTFQWRKNGVNLSDNGRVSGSATTTLTITAVEPGDADSYDCLVTELATGCSNASHPATLTTPCLKFTQQPGSDGDCEQSSAALSMAVDVVGATYQWRRGTTSLVDDGHFSGVTTPTLTIVSLALADAGNDYNCLVSRADAACSLASNNGVISVTPGPQFTQQPGDANVNPGDSVSFNVTTSTPFYNYSYQWRRNGLNLADDARIIGALSQSLTIDPVDSPDAGGYDCVVTTLTTNCVLNTNSATLTVGAPPGCQGDLTNDGARDLSDLTIILGNYGRNPATAADGDLDGNGQVDLADVSIMLSLYGAPC